MLFFVNLNQRELLVNFARRANFKLLSDPNRTLVLHL